MKDEKPYIVFGFDDGNDNPNVYCPPSLIKKWKENTVYKNTDELIRNKKLIKFSEFFDTKYYPGILNDLSFSASAFLDKWNDQSDLWGLIYKDLDSLIYFNYINFSIQMNNHILEMRMSSGFGYNGDINTIKSTIYVSGIKTDRIIKTNLVEKLFFIKRKDVTSVFENMASISEDVENISTFEKI